MPEHIYTKCLPCGTVNRDVVCCTVCHRELDYPVNRWLDTFFERQQALAKEYAIQQEGPPRKPPNRNAIDRGREPPEGMGFFGEEAP